MYFNPSDREDNLKYFYATSITIRYHHHVQFQYILYLFLRGTRQKTNGGLQKGGLIKNKSGKVVSKKMHSRGVRVYKKNGLDKWTKAFMQARKNLNVSGFVPCKKGTALYRETSKLYRK